DVRIINFLGRFIETEVVAGRLNGGGFVDEPLTLRFTRRLDSTEEALPEADGPEAAGEGDGEGWGVRARWRSGPPSSTPAFVAPGQRSRARRRSLRSVRGSRRPSAPRTRADCAAPESSGPRARSGPRPRPGPRSASPRRTG